MATKEFAQGHPTTWDTAKMRLASRTLFLERGAEMPKPRRQEEGYWHTHWPKLSFLKKGWWYRRQMPSHRGWDGTKCLCQILGLKMLVQPSASLSLVLHLPHSGSPQDGHLRRLWPKLQVLPRFNSNQMILVACIGKNSKYALVSLENTHDWLAMSATCKIRKQWQWFLQDSPAPWDGKWEGSTQD